MPSFLGAHGTERLVLISNEHTCELNYEQLRIQAMEQYTDRLRVKGGSIVQQQEWMRSDTAAVG